jgi:hypothetical protein
VNCLDFAGPGMANSEMNRLYARWTRVLNLPRILGRILCLLGLHDYRLVERSVSFGSEGGVEKVQCKRCGLTIMRQG